MSLATGSLPFFPMVRQIGRVIHSSMWKSLWKTPFFNSQIFEFYGLLALCTYFVQILFTGKTQLYLHLTGKLCDLLGFFKAFSEARNFLLQTCAKLFRIHQKTGQKPGLVARRLFVLFFENLAEAVAEVISRLQHLARFRRAFGRADEAAPLHHIQNLRRPPVADR